MVKIAPRQVQVLGWVLLQLSVLCFLVSTAATATTITTTIIAVVVGAIVAMVVVVGVVVVCLEVQSEEEVDQVP